MSDLLIRCSALGDIMTGVAKGWPVEKSETCKKMLLKLYRQQKYKRYTSLSNKYIEKGNECEEDGITQLNRFLVATGQLPFDGSRVLVKNTERLNNQYVTGEYDLAIKDNAGRILETMDIKCAWSLDTLPHEKVHTVDSGYMYQGHGYLWLTDADIHTVAHVLVNATPRLIDQAKKKVFWNSDSIDVDNDPEYINQCQRIEREMIFDMPLFRQQNPHYILHTDLDEWQYDIPLSERVVLFRYLHSDEVIEGMANRIAECQQWVNDNLETNRI